MPKKKMTNTDFMYLSQYLEQALDWQLWVKSADDLLAASEKLEPSIKKYWLAATGNLKEGRYSEPKKKPGRSLQAIYSMLVAYAIENLYKASLILQNKKQYEQEILQKGGLPSEIKTSRHDLLGLVHKLNLNIDADETNLLLRLSRNSYWQGRYPVPVKAKGLNSVIKDDNRNIHFVAFLAPDDIQKLKLLIKRIKKNIKDDSS
ncbi:MAG: hypothetical protein KAT53_07865 [Dehalococcoidia bacterium]|nr:hypothetical protein [Dehalococcoidia bacterium]